jgi:hypothetical protein
MGYKIILLCIINFCFSINSNACTCGYLFKTDNLNERINESNEIFIGSVIKKEFVKNEEYRRNLSDSLLIKVDFLVSKIYKGKKILTTISIYQHYDNCMIFFEIDKEYLMFTYKHKSRKYKFTNECTPTHIVDESKEYNQILVQVKESR